jgi:hypothetical protein
MTVHLTNADPCYAQACATNATASTYPTFIPPIIQDIGDEACHTLAKQVSLIIFFEKDC